MHHKRKLNQRIRLVPDSLWNLSAASTKPSVTRKFMTRVFISSFLSLTAFSFFSHSSRVITFFEVAWSVEKSWIKEHKSNTTCEEEEEEEGISIPYAWVVFFNLVNDYNPLNSTSYLSLRSELFNSLLRSNQP